MALLVSAAFSIALPLGSVAAQSATTDYDTDDDGLIEVSNLDQLNVMRYDLDGNGSPSSGNESSYAAAFPGAVSGMGCPSTCTGYELTADLDFDTNGDGRTDITGDAYWNDGVGWHPIGSVDDPFDATFHGNGHLVSNLFINHDGTGYSTALFGGIGPTNVVREVRLHVSGDDPNPEPHHYDSYEECMAEPGNTDWYCRQLDYGPSPTHHDTDITISGLASSIEKGKKDGFTVVAELEIGTHTISVTASGGVRLGSSCSSKPPPPRSVDNDGTNLPGHMYYWSLTAYGCNTPGGTVSASVSPASDSQYVTVWEDKVPSLPSVSNRSGTVGTSLNIQLPAGSGGDPPLSYSASPLPAGLSFSSSTRRITGTPTTAQTVNVTYRVTDSDGDSDTSAFTFTINAVDRIPSLPSVSNRSGTVGTSVSVQLPAATGGDPPLSYTASPLPSGLSFSSSTRRITGTPTMAQTVNVSYRVTDSDGDDDTRTFTFTVAPPTPTVTPPAPDGFSAGAIGTGSMRLTWQARIGTTGYHITYRKDTETTWTEEAQNDQDTANTYDVTGLECGTTYKFAIQVLGDGQTYQRDWGDFAYADGTTDLIRDLGQLDYHSTTQPPYTSPRIKPVSGVWNNSCSSRYQQLQGIGDIPAKYYIFTLTKDDSHVIVDLAAGSSTTGLDPYLVLWETSASTYFFNDKMTNDDNDEEYMRTNPTKDSRIALELPAGTYTIEATLAEAPPASSTAREFALDIKVAEVIPYLGHQADFTVEYRIGTPVPTPTPTPTPDPLNPTPPSPQLPNAAVIIPTAIPDAAEAWNDAVSTSWPHVLMCEEGNCGSRNTDKKWVVVDVVDGSVHKTSSLLNPLNTSCGYGTACVKPSPILSVWNLDPPGNGHMGNLSMLIEEPAWLGETRAVWTDVPSLHDDEVRLRDGTKGVYRHALAVVMHEFGHAAGLDDLYKEEYGGKYPGYVMEDERETTSIPDLDRDYLRQVYRNEHGAKPH